MKLKIIILGILIFLIFSGIWVFSIEPNFIKTEKLFLEIENLPSSFQGLKILHLSDLHTKNFGKKEKRILEISKKINPDFIFITGDIVDWETRNFDSCQKFWKELSENYQGRIFGVFGNHEHRNRNFKKLNKFLKDNGIKILINESLVLKRNNDLIYLIGTDDPHLGYDDIKKAVREIKNDIMVSDSAKILLAHSPEIFRKVKTLNEKIDLTLAGHTHGCQVNLPFICDFILTLKYDKKYKKGLFKENSVYLYVNRGIGTTFLPLRFNSFPEAALIELKKH